ncbi:hypothetical protein JOH51_005870 [Rhizobium leguminosarum]|nr:hypothetical protein [Rhizobium leguminosarum]
MRSFAVEPQPIHAHRAADVPDLLLASEIERPIEFALEIIIGPARRRHAARLDQMLQLRGDIFVEEKDLDEKRPAKSLTGCIAKTAATFRKLKSK